jgi:hypothetical protein
MAATYVGDDVTETEELRQAFDRWAGESADTVDATVDASGGGPFTVRSCAA